MGEDNKPIVSEKELSLVDENLLTQKQLNQILKKTPSKYLKKRPAKGGGTWDYVTGGYVKKCLNLLFGWNWDFEIIDEKIIHDEAIVKGRLTCRLPNGKSIVKMQYGNKDIIYKKNSDKVPLSIGNDLKSAATDSLKKCASEIGIAADIYNKEEFREFEVVNETDILDLLIALFEKNGKHLSQQNRDRIQLIIETEETVSYKKAIKELQKK